MEAVLDWLSPLEHVSKAIRYLLQTTNQYGFLVIEGFCVSRLGEKRKLSPNAVVPGQPLVLSFV